MKQTLEEAISGFQLNSSLEYQNFYLERCKKRLSENDFDMLMQKVLQLMSKKDNHIKAVCRNPIYVPDLATGVDFIKYKYNLSDIVTLRPKCKCGNRCAEISAYADFGDIGRQVAVVVVACEFCFENNLKK